MTMSIGACCIVGWVISCIGIIVGGFGIYFALTADYEAMYENELLEKTYPDFTQGYPQHHHTRTSPGYTPSVPGGPVKTRVPTHYAGSHYAPSSAGRRSSYHKTRLE